MKSCPSCNLKYADDTLQFCLNDGTQLTEFIETEEPATVFSSGVSTTEKSPSSHSNFEQMSVAPDSAHLQEANSTLFANQPTQELFSAKENASDELFIKILTFAPIVVALMQNYWQWLYMSKYDSFQFPSFLWELNFWVWLILLFSGTALCVLAIKNNKNRGFAVVGLVILAINFLLCLAPRR
ncbi:MAG: hypothetical protein ABI954_02090 [Pyrinomonadaceae bacterium]